MKKFALNEPQDYLALLIRRKLWVVVSLVLILSATVLVSLLLPDVYVSSTLILVEPRDVPDDVVKEFVTASTEQRLNSIQETVLSRTNLLRIINQFPEGMDELRALEEQAQVERMRRRIAITITADRTSRDSIVPFFEISYQDTDPELAQKVTSRLASLFIEYDAKTREAQVFGTVDFLKNELEKVSVQLRDAEKALSQLKDQYRYELPEQLEANLRTLDRLQEERKANSESYDRYMSLKLDLDRQLSETPPVITQQMQRQVGGAARSTRSPLVEEYKTKERELKELSSKYTAKHPDVLRLKGELEALRGEIRPEDLVEIDQSVELEPTQISQPNPLYQNLVSQLRQVNTELSISREKRNWIEQEIQRFNRRVENTPKREQEIADLKRRYEGLSKQYDTLKANLNQAELAQSLESRQKGEQFQIVDPASYPVSPSKPNRLWMLAVGLFGGLGFGAALALGVDFADQKVWSYAEIEKLLGVPVVAEIPEIVTDQELVGKKRGDWLRVSLFVLFCAACAGSVFLIYATPEFRSMGSEILVQVLKW